MTTITLYSRTGRTGEAFTTQCPIQNLKDYDFNDKASSCEINQGAWILYKDSGFRGQNLILEEGTHSTLNIGKFSNDILSSLLPLPPSDTPKILLFQDSFYHGRVITLTREIRDLSTIDFENQTSSIIVLGGEWQIFNKPDFGDPVSSFVLRSNGGTDHNGRYPEPKGVFKNDSIASLRPVE